MLLVANKSVTLPDAMADSTWVTVSRMDFDVSVKITCTTTVKLTALLLLRCTKIITLLSGKPSSLARTDLRLSRTDELTCCVKVNVMFTTYSCGSEEGGLPEDSVIGFTQAFDWTFKDVPTGHPPIKQDPSYKGKPTEHTVHVVAVQFWQLSGQLAHCRSALYVATGQTTAHVP